MISDTRMWYGSSVRRQGRSRRWTAYQRRSLCWKRRQTRRSGMRALVTAAIVTDSSGWGKSRRRTVLRQFASPYFVARSPATVDVQEVRLPSRASSRLVWLATCHSTKLMHYPPPALRGFAPPRFVAARRRSVERPAAVLELTLEGSAS